MRLIRDGAAVASCAAVACCPVRRGGGFLPGAARRWRLARCGAAVASCPMQSGSGFLPDVARRWLRCQLSSNVLRTDSEGLRVSKVSEMSSKMWRIEDECR